MLSAAVSSASICSLAPGLATRAPSFAHLAAADDLKFRYGVDAPTVRIDGMTVAGA